MAPWLHRMLRSRRAGPLLALGTSVVALGSCGGALLANYTVAGMDLSYRAAAGPMPRVAETRERGWADRAADDFMDEGRVVATKAGYAPDGSVEYAIGD